MRSQKTWAIFAMVCLIFGTTFLAIRLGLEAGASPLFFASLRFVLAGGILAALLVVRGRLSLRGALRMAPRAAALSLFMTVGTFGCMFIAETRVDSGLMARLDSGGPLVTALFAAFFLGKKLSVRHVLAFAAGTAGTVLVASPAVGAEPAYLAVAVGSVVLYAAGNALYPRLFRAEEDPAAANALQSLLGGIVLLGASMALETPVFPSAAIGPLVWLVLAGSIVAHTAVLVLVRDAGPVFASGWLYASPGVATLAGAVVLEERITAQGVIGTVLALAGVFLLNRAETPSLDGGKTAETG